MHLSKAGSRLVARNSATLETLEIKIIIYICMHAYININYTTLITVLFRVEKVKIGQ